MAKELTTKQAIFEAIHSMAGDREVTTTFQVEALLDLQSEIEGQLKPLKAKAIAELKRQQESVAKQLKALGVGKRGRPEGAKNKPKGETANG